MHAKGWEFWVQITLGLCLELYLWRSTFLRMCGKKEVEFLELE